MSAIASSGEAVLKAPFPAFGGKSRVADEVWRRFGGSGAGGVRNYVEPFAFSAAVLLRRPGGAGPVETINDLNAYVANFWRAVRADPDAVAHHADWPVNETDLHARHRWLVNSCEAQESLRVVREDPEGYDARIAGWWCWGACCWIGSGWCDENSRNSRSETRPDLDMGQMVTSIVPHAKRIKLGEETRMGGVLHPGEKRVKLTGNGVGAGVHSNPAAPSEQIPLLSSGFGQGVNGNLPESIQPPSPPAKIPPLDAAGRGVQGSPTPSLSQQLPHLDAAPSGRRNPKLDDNAAGESPQRTNLFCDRGVNAGSFDVGTGVNGNDRAGTCAARSAWIRDWMRRLCDRLRPVRVCCGHWARVCDSPSTMTRLGATGVFLDPPIKVSKHPLALTHEAINSHPKRDLRW